MAIYINLVHTHFSDETLAQADRSLTQADDNYSVNYWHKLIGPCHFCSQ